MWAVSGVRPGNIPSNPNLVSRASGAGYTDWLGNPTWHELTRWRSFQEARAYVRSLGLPGRVASRAWSGKPCPAVQYAVQS